MSQQTQDPRSDGGHTETRRRFIERARAAAALPVVTVLSMSWSQKANAY